MDLGNLISDTLVSVVALCLTNKSQILTYAAMFEIWDNANGSR